MCETVREWAETEETETAGETRGVLRVCTLCVGRQRAVKGGGACGGGRREAKLYLTLAVASAIGYELRDQSFACATSASQPSARRVSVARVKALSLAGHPRRLNHCRAAQNGPARTILNLGGRGAARPSGGVDNSPHGRPLPRLPSWQVRRVPLLALLQPLRLAAAVGLRSAASDAEAGAAVEHGAAGVHGLAARRPGLPAPAAAPVGQAAADRLLGGVCQALAVAAAAAHGGGGSARLHGTHLGWPPFLPHASQHRRALDLAAGRLAMGLRASSHGDGDCV